MEKYLTLLAVFIEMVSDSRFDNDITDEIREIIFDNVNEVERIVNELETVAPKGNTIFGDYNGKFKNIREIIKHYKEEQ